MTGSIVVLGSINHDLVLTCDRLPQPGETVNGGELRQWTGGKGANQAVAASRLGARVELIAAVGADENGATALATLRREGVDVAMVRTVPGVATGVAMVLVDRAGANAIALAAGANHALLPEHLEAHRQCIEQAAVLVVQLEILPETVAYAIEIAHAAGVPVLLNPAPVVSLPPALLRKVSVLVPNEHEARLLANEFGLAAFTAKELLQTGAQSCIVTLGEQGIEMANATVNWASQPEAVKAVDTTGAGDTFIGAFAVGLAEQMTLKAAALFAQSAATLSVTRAGAMPSMPKRAELATMEIRREENSLA
ncbi:MAG TPA: ribokinase [Polaromonas sp.]|uniref:ribokinase n=1 Tax=Polaromonas sp. TaxID=1869339 RepID=UPI002D45A634|nr:ribokinase [Polaromonas sp.]HYW56237.1 ribokinase [Polaromonas sp.]